MKGVTMNLSQISEALTYWHYINSLPGPSVPDEKNGIAFEFSDKCHRYKKESKVLNKQLDAAKRGSNNCNWRDSRKVGLLE